MKDSEFLQWIHDRLVEVHKENKNYDYMHRLRAVISKVKMDEQLAESTTSHPHIDLRKKVEEALDSLKETKE